jgi:epoxyqueuosine reductase QueG
MKERIRRFAAGMEIDDVGFASASDYRSSLSPPLESIFPGVRSIVVLVYKELDSCDSPDLHIAMNGRMDLMEFSRSCNYKLARHLERRFGARAMTVPASYPMAQNEESKGAVGQVSLRHAAVAAGLGAFGSNNLVVHPRFGCRTIFTAILTDLEIPSDPPVVENPCTVCGLCVRGCPGKALEEPGRTDVPAAERKAMLRDPNYWRLYQAGHIGPQYFCFACMNVCPVGRKATERRREWQWRRSSTKKGTGSATSH